MLRPVPTGMGGDRLPGPGTGARDLPRGDRRRSHLSVGDPGESCKPIAARPLHDARARRRQGGGYSVAGRWR
jgi:hypothetical protein